MLIASACLFANGPCRRRQHDALASAMPCLGPRSKGHTADALARARAPAAWQKKKKPRKKKPYDDDDADEESS
jgi:hypothetical protein